MSNPIDEFRKRLAEQRAQNAEFFRERAEAQTKARAFAIYTARGGRPEDFEGEWLQIRRDVLRDAMINSARGK